MRKCLFFIFFAAVAVLQTLANSRAAEDENNPPIVLVVNEPSFINGVLREHWNFMRAQLRDARIGYTGLSSGGRAVQVRIRESTEIEKAKAVLAGLLLPKPVGATDRALVAELALQEPEPGLLRYALTDDGLKNRLANAVAKSIEALDRRLDELPSEGKHRSLFEKLWTMVLGTSVGTIERQGECIFVKVPKDLISPQRLISMLQTPARLTLQLVDVTMSASDAINRGPPAGSAVVYTTSVPPQPYLVEDRIIVSDENIVDARAAIDGRTNEPVVSFRLDAKGAARFGQATVQNIGRLIAVIFDNRAVSVALIREPILGGTGQISGNFTIEAASEVAMLLRTGSLPFELDVINVIPTRDFCTITLSDK